MQDVYAVGSPPPQILQSEEAPTAANGSAELTCPLNRRELPWFHR